ncbi:hypothetical protein QAD02_012767 [Eretmocerus hayati]|uniref:Uncharacterized protein n=1 Tax=Eretmocerus hayati TaxID=131215 RepID=A0ACC2P5D3_9HYME|nr:hypothetical protein QAD02_012767 [Eretmocerus hayati]
MQSRYYKHWFFFVYGVTPCSQNYVSESDIAKAEEAFALFVQGVEPLYGKKYMKFVLHLTAHTIKFVKLYGALWAWSASPFEGFNGTLAALFHGTQYLLVQVNKLASRIQYLKNNAYILALPGVSVAAN